MTGTGTDRPLAVVTGASSGIGLELARLFAAHGYDLVVVAEDAAIHDVAASLDTWAQPAQEDLATRDGNDNVLGLLDAMARPVAAAAINAGIGVGGRFVETSLEDDLRLVGLNVASTVHLAKGFGRSMVAHGGGRLLFTSSIASQMPGPLNATYAASKSFVQSLSQALRQELADSGVTVTALLPGPTDTEFFERADLQDATIAQGHKDSPSHVALAGFEAMMAGEAQVIPGQRNRVQAVASKILPDAVKARLHGKLNDGAQD